ncbi:MAG: rod shape-determining protein MreD [Actinobacteria bacterium]|nr:MAG: rod shape-determining protein MreD [Actinomycetota bacterium]
MNRFWTGAAAIAASVVLQVMLASHIAPFGVVPSFPLLVVITLAFVQGPGSGASAGFAAGLALDLLGSGPIGAWALVLTVVGYLAGMLEANLFAEGWLLPVTVALLAGIAAEFAYLIVLSVLGVDVAFWKSVLGVVIPRGIYNSVLALLLYPWLARFLRTDRSVKSFRRLA